MKVEFNEKHSIISHMPKKLNDSDGLLCAYLLDRKGSGKALSWKGIQEWTPEQGLLWVNVNYTHPATKEWIKTHDGLDKVIIDALLMTGSRPRILTTDTGLYVSLRGVNLTPGASPDELVSLRIWIEKDKIITTQRERVLSIEDLKEEIKKNKAPKTPGEFLVKVTTHLIDRMSESVNDLLERTDKIEDKVLAPEKKDVQRSLSVIRRQMISLHRYLAPQRDAMIRLLTESDHWLTEKNKINLKELTNGLTRYIEDIDTLRDRCTITQEEINNSLLAQFNRRIYVLSLITMIFLPLMFITSLLGSNIGGIPGAHASFGFIVEIALLGLCVLFELWLFKRIKWF